MPVVRIKAQHVAHGDHVDAIQQEGFKVRPRGQHFAHVFGPGVYFGFRGDKESEAFYANNGHDRTPYKSRVIEVSVKLMNPLVCSGHYRPDVVRSMITAFGGPAAAAEAVNRANLDLRTLFNRMDDPVTVEWAERLRDDPYADYDAEEIFGYAARAIGHDGVVVDQGEHFYSGVGGSQVVVFHPTKQNIRITKVRKVETGSFW